MSRIKEPSTWAGIASIFAAMATLPIPVAQPWLAGVAGIAGSVAVKKEADVSEQ